eukprot:3672162-Alexandrium_andersonii.AAC.1
MGISPLATAHAGQILQRSSSSGPVVGKCAGPSIGAAQQQCEWPLEPSSSSGLLRRALRRAQSSLLEQSSRGVLFVEASDHGNRGFFPPWVVRGR